jgi:hypothetical protein
MSWRNLLNQARGQITRMAGTNPVVQGLVKVYNKIPVAINPIRTRTPTTQAGAWGKALNPLNPANAALGIIGTKVPEIPGSIPELLIGLQGSAPYSDNPYDNWKALRYKSREDMMNRVGQQMVREAAMPDPYMFWEALGYKSRQDMVNRVGVPAPRSATQPAKPAASPPATGLRLAAPAEPAYRPPAPARTSYVAPSTPAPQVPASSGPRPAQVTRVAQAPRTQLTQPAAAPVEQVPDSALAREYAQQRRVAELLGAEEMVRRLNAARPMTTVGDEDLLTWADANPALAYREMLRRERLNAQTSSL